MEDWEITRTIGEPVCRLSGVFLSENKDGEPIETRGGDVLFFPENSRGTWEIIETVRKA